MPDESLFERYKNEIRTRLSVRDLVEEAKPKGLRATGASSLICCSPLRVDKSPSFSVFESGGGEYVGFDHATRESFDLYGYIEKKEGLSFAEAVKWAGDRVGMPWDDYKKQNSDGTGIAPPPAGISQEAWDKARDEVLALDERQLVGNMQQAMVDLAHGMFLRSGLPAYVEKRWGISPETQNRFMLGFIPHGFGSLLKDWNERNLFPYGPRKLLKTGWFIPRGHPADPKPDIMCIFDGRLLYPYLFRGKCRYAAARIIYEKDIEPSYFVGREWDASKFKKAMVNGPSRPSVSKYVQNDILYNADNLLRSRSGFKRIVIVEGPSDCMAMIEHGYDCVAPVTTSVRVEDIPALVRDVEKYEEIVLATDTDITEDGRRPGLEGALRMAPALMEAGKKVRLFILPLAKGQTKVDPASWNLQWKTEDKTGDPFAKLMAALPSVARGLAQFLDPDLTGERLPEALTEIVKFARIGKLSKAETQDVARDIRKRLKDNFTRSAILTAMGEVGERIDKEERPIDDEKKTLTLDGAVTERGGFDETDRTCAYETWSKTGGAVIADFILQPERILTVGPENLLEVSIYKDMNAKLVDRWLVPNQAWVSKREFKSALMKVTHKASFTGSDDNVQGIRKLVSDRATRLNVPQVRGESIIGLHYTPGGLRLVLPTETWDGSGIMVAPDTVFSAEWTPHPLANMIKVDGKQDPGDVDDLVKRAMELIFKLNDPVVLTTICAWILGCYFLPSIRELNGGKATILNVYGSPGSGKSTLMQKILNVTLLPFGKSFEPAAPAETTFATVRTLAWANIFCAPFDEFRISEAGKDFVRILRTGFSGGIENRGRQDMGIRSFSLVGAVQLSGEQRADVDTAMAERLVMVALSRTTIEQTDMTSALYDVLAINEKWRIATDILQWRMTIDPPMIANWWVEAKELANVAVDGRRLRVAPRTFDVCVEMAFRMRALQEWIKYRKEARVIDVKLASVEDVIVRMMETTTERDLPNGTDVTAVAAKSLVVRALDDASVYAVQGTFEEGRGWRVCIRNERRMLVVHPGAMASVLAREHRSRGTPDPTNGLAALKASAREEYARGGDIGWLVDPSFRFRMGSDDEIGGDTKGPTMARCWLIDIAKASERAGLDLDWPGTATTWGGERKKVAAGTIGKWERTGWKGASAKPENNGA